VLAPGRTWPCAYISSAAASPSVAVRVLLVVVGEERVKAKKDDDTRRAGEQTNGQHVICSCVQQSPPRMLRAFFSFPMAVVVTSSP